VTSALDDEPQPMLPGEFDGRNDVLCIPCYDRIGALPGFPGVQPTHRLRAANEILDRERIPEVAHRAGAGFTARVSLA
jgi:hypothetical protein